MKKLKEWAKKIFIALGLAVIFAGAAITVKDEIYYNFFYDSDSGELQDAGCLGFENTALISIHGTINTYTIDPEKDVNGTYDPDSVSGEEILRKIDEIGQNDRIKGIIVEIDSMGGSPVASEEIMKALDESGKPVAAFIRDAGLSGGYMIALGADKIYASDLSDVGSIGITMSYLDYSQKNKKDGLTYNQLSTGKYKDTGDPDKELTEEEKTLIMRDLQKGHNIFVGYVAKHRNLDIETVKKLADGNSMVAADALSAGLIDAIGGLNEAKAYISSKIGEDASICVY